MREKYESLSVAVLRDLAKAREIPGISGMKKAELVEAMLAQDELDAASNKPEEKSVKPRRTERGERTEKADRGEKRENTQDGQAEQSPPEVCMECCVILEVLQDG